MKTALVLTAALVGLAPALTVAADLEGRVTRIENILENQRGSDLLLQVQRLQAEVQLLRGMVEQQQFDLETLQREQRDQYLDLDSRLGGRGGAPQPAQTQRPEDAVRTPRAPAPGGATSGGQAISDEGPDAAPPAPQASMPAGEREAYRQAFDALKQRRYDEAEAAFKDLLARHPNGELADNAHYWLAETYYVKRDHGAALAEFQRVLDDYPQSAKAAGSMLKIGYIQDERKDWSRARETLKAVIAKFPDSTEARLAKGRLERMARDGR